MKLDSDELDSIRAERQRTEVASARAAGRAEGALMLAVGILIYVLFAKAWPLAVAAICGG